jgi:hypothetical protein
LESKSIILAAINNFKNFFSFSLNIITPLRFLFSPDHFFSGWLALYSSEDFNLFKIIFFSCPRIEIEIKIYAKNR